MSHGVNVLLEDEVWPVLRELPRGERSHAVNQALTRWSISHRRQGAVERLKERRRALPPVPGATEDWVRADRDSH